MMTIGQLRCSPRTSLNYPPSETARGC